MPATFRRLERRSEKVDEAALSVAQREARREERAAKDRRKLRAEQISLEQALGKAAAEIGLTRISRRAMLGAIYSLEDDVADPKIIARWEAKAGDREEQAAIEREAIREPLVIVFPSPVTGLEAGVLKSKGFRLNRLFSRWEGHAVLEEALTLARAHDGVVSRVAADGSLIRVEEEPISLRAAE